MLSFGMRLNQQSRSLGMGKGDWRFVNLLRYKSYLDLHFRDTSANCAFPEGSANLISKVIASLILGTRDMILACITESLRTLE